MSKSGSYTVTDPSRELDRELQRLGAQALFLWEKERRALAGYGLRDGMSLLELGSGPGFVTEQLLAWLPISRKPILPPVGILPGSVWGSVKPEATLPSTWIWSRGPFLKMATWYFFCGTLQRSLPESIMFRPGLRRQLDLPV